MLMFICYFCKKPVEIERKVGFREECLYCRQDLHLCLNCKDYDPNAYHQCRESQADFVSQKEKGNICEYFSFQESKPGGEPATDNRAEAEKLWAKMTKK